MTLSNEPANRLLTAGGRNIDGRLPRLLPKPRLTCGDGAEGTEADRTGTALEDVVPIVANF
jgi:hypothetical protein